jgi:hypothetical protein
VNNFRAFVLFPLLALIAAPGCEKTNDVPRLKDEALAVKKDYEQRFDELAHRAEAIGRRGKTLPPDAQDAVSAQRIFRQALSRIEEDRGNLQQVPTGIEAGAKSGNPEELGKLIDGLRERLDRGVVETTSDLAAVESWLGVVEQQQRAARAQAAPPAPDPDAPIR